MHELTPDGVFFVHEIIPFPENFQFVNSPTVKRIFCRKQIALENFDLSNINYYKSMLFCIFDSVGCSSTIFGLIAYTYAAVIYQMAVALEHTSSGVHLGSVHHLIRLGLDALVFLYILGGPAPCLRQAGQNKDQFNVQVLLFQLEDSLRRESVEATGTPCTKKLDAIFYLVNNGLLQFFSEFPSVPSCWQLPVASKATGLHLFFSHFHF